MLENQSGTVRAVAWPEICPWLALLRTFRLAVSFRILVLGAVAMLLTASVWGLFGWMFSSGGTEATAWTQAYTSCPWMAVADMVPNAPELPLVSDLAQGGQKPRDPVFYPWAQLGRPLWEAFRPGATVSDLACLLLCGLSSLAIWAFFGGAITRIAAVQLASEERVGWGAALRYACSKWLAYFCAPLFPVAGIVLAGVPICLLGLALQVGPGVFFVGLIWPVLLILGLIMALLLLGLVFGWPLMWGTISAEGTDSFDALSRSYAYVFQRPVRYLFYAVVAAVFGFLAWLLVKNFAAAVIWLTYWAASWGGTDDQVNAIMHTPPSLEGMGYAGAVVIHFWVGCAKLLAVGFVYGYFWTAVTAIYFLLRRDVDATEMDEVFRDADESEQAYGLPPLKTDAAGAPVVGEGAEAQPPAQTDGGGTEPAAEV